MAEPKFTKGPWQRFDNGGVMSVRGGVEHTYGAGYADCVWGPNGPGHGLVADCSPNSQAPTAETIANARLIAAAPEMYEALKEARETIRELVNARWSEAEGSAYDWTKQIDAALSSATGEA